tara:strand:+ start:50 stop:289 length:240 start_codon:yes stop_codon:yes gene_type:complete
LLLKSCAAQLDVEEFTEKGDSIVFALKKTDDSYYGVVFASKGSSMLEGIYKEAKASVDRSLIEFDEIISLLKEAQAPGV